MRPIITRDILDKLYREYNRRELVSPDPIQFLWDYDDPLDREIVGLISSSLAYGRVAQILSSVSSVLEKMPRPLIFLKKATAKSLRRTFEGFKHRFTTGKELALMLYGAKLAIERHGSLQGHFLMGYNEKDETTLPALESFVKGLFVDENTGMSYLLPLPSRGSACKRLNLFLRWMVREDDVDPGGWSCVPASKLVIPLDTHMDNICRTLGITGRKQANMKTAIEITSFFREMNTDDPIKYDFALTRLGILENTDLSSFLEKWRIREVA